MSQAQAFRHQTYSSTPPSSPHYSVCPPSYPEVGSREFAHRMQRAGATLREAGLSPLHNIRRVIRLDALPLLGTGKTDYRALKARLRDAADL